MRKRPGEESESKRNEFLVFYFSGKFDKLPYKSHIEKFTDLSRKVEK